MRAALKILRRAGERAGSTGMTCDEVRDLLELYALGVLDEDERFEVATHLATDCRDCNADLRKAIRLNSAVLMTAEEKAISPALRKRVLARLKPYSSVFGSVGSWIWGRSRRGGARSGSMERSTEIP